MSDEPTELNFYSGPDKNWNVTDEQLIGLPTEAYFSEE